MSLQQQLNALRVSQVGLRYRIQALARRWQLISSPVALYQGDKQGRRGRFLVLPIALLPGQGRVIWVAHVAQLLQRAVRQVKAQLKGRDAESFGRARGGDVQAAGDVVQLKLVLDGEQQPVWLAALARAVQFQQFQLDRLNQVRFQRHVHPLVAGCRAALVPPVGPLFALAPVVKDADAVSAAFARAAFQLVVLLLAVDGGRVCQANVNLTRFLIRRVGAAGCALAAIVGPLFAFAAIVKYANAMCAVFVAAHLQSAVLLLTVDRGGIGQPHRLFRFNGRSIASRRASRQPQEDRGDQDHYGHLLFHLFTPFLSDLILLLGRPKTRQSSAKGRPRARS